MRISMKSLSVIFELDNMIEYIDLIEDVIGNNKIQIEEYGQQIDTQLSKLEKNQFDSEEEYEYYEQSIIDDFIDENYKKTDIFPQKLRVTTFIHLCSILESTFSSQDVFDNSAMKIIDKYRGSYILKRFKYLKHEKKLNLDEISDSWELLFYCNDLRNAFVHNEGILKSKGSRSSNIIIALDSFLTNVNKKELISINEYGKISLNEGFNSYYLECMENILIQLDILPFSSLRRSY